MMDLLEFAKPIAAELPLTDEDDTYLFTPDTFSTMPDTFSTSDLLITRMYHDYDIFRIDQPQFHTTKNAYEALGIAILGAWLTPNFKELVINLTNAKSDIKKIKITAWQPDLKNEFIRGLQMKPIAFAYVAERAVGNKPWLNSDIPDPYHLPELNLSTDDDDPITEEQWQNRDVLRGFGRPEGASRLAQLFLDMSRPSNKTDEVILETEGGFRGVAPLSVEARFWLPGGLGYLAP